jgi:hypothetical protein
MALAAYKDLCMDAADPRLLGEFWAGALGLELRDAGPDSAGDVVLVGPTPGHTIWINAVPEPRRVKHRWHIDVNVSSVDELVALGATVLDADSFRWTLMADPEGGELCAFVREAAIERRLYEIVADCQHDEAERIAMWWADVLGASLETDDEGVAVTDIGGAPFDYLVFGPVPEPKTAKNRLHLDVTTPDLDLLVGAGATVLSRPSHGRWTVLADPLDNEFCAFPV